MKEQMKSLSQFIVEARTGKPTSKEELRKILEQRLKEDKNANLNDIDVSKITDMSDLFKDLDPHKIDISEWDVSNVENMDGMFKYCTNFNSDLSKWDVSNVKYMWTMFYCCYEFDSDLSNWNTSKVEDKTDMFEKCKSLKKRPKWSYK